MNFDWMRREPTRKGLKRGKLRTAAAGTLLFGLSFLGATRANATELTVSGRAGAIGSGSSSNLGYGAALTFNPYDIAAFIIDATFSSGLSDGPAIQTGYFSTSPSMIYYPYIAEELRFGVLGGAGFYKFSGLDTKFGLDIGAVADFSLSKAFCVGLDTRFHYLFNNPSNAWNVFLTAGMRFTIGSDW